MDQAVDAVAELKRLGHRPLLLARGGSEGEPHGQEVLARAQQAGLSVSYAKWNGQDASLLSDAIRPVIDADVVNLQTYLSQAQRKVLFRVVNLVLANSGVEPFGLVGLEAMSVGGLAFVGCTGEDYATQGHDAVVLQTNDHQEIVYHAARLRQSPELAHQMRLAARASASRYTWPWAITKILLPFLRQSGLDVPEHTALPGTMSGQPIEMVDELSQVMGAISSDGTIEGEATSGEIARATRDYTVR